MKTAILTVMIVAALSGAQASAAASESLPEAQVGSGTTPGLTAQTSSQRMFDSFEATEADDADEAHVDNMPEANVGDGSRAD